MIRRKSNIKNPDIDARIIASFNSEHMSRIMTSIEYGKHIMVEKPMVGELEQPDQIEVDITYAGSFWNRPLPYSMTKRLPHKSLA